MFEEVIGCLRQSQSAFNSKIQDSFGRSIDAKVFEPTDRELGKLEEAYTEAEIKISEINAMTLILRTIV